MGREYIENWSPRDYRTLQDVSAEIDRIQAADHEGTLQATGNWSPGQIMDHTARLLEGSLDGFDARAPLPIRLLGRFVFKPRLGRSHMKPGIQLPKKAVSVLPAEVVATPDGIARMRSVLTRIQSGEKMMHDSPVLGKMSHEQWELFHCDHCRLHFGFLKLPLDSGQNPHE